MELNMKMEHGNTETSLQRCNSVVHCLWANDEQTTP